LRIASRSNCLDALKLVEGAVESAIEVRLVADDLFEIRGRRMGYRRRYSAWAELLRRVFAVDVLLCPRCGGVRRLLAAIQDPDSIERVLRAMGLPFEVPELAPARAPPEVEAVWAPCGDMPWRGRCNCLASTSLLNLSAHAPPSPHPDYSPLPIRPSSLDTTGTDYGAAKAHRNPDAQ
jgi:hypothetical protein